MRYFANLFFGLLVLVSIPSVAAAEAPRDLSEGVRRVQPDGRIEITANDFFDLGAKLGYASGQDNFCNAVEAYVGYAGEKARYLEATSENIAEDAARKALKLQFTTVSSNKSQSRYGPNELAYLQGYVLGFNSFASDKAEIARLHSSCSEDRVAQYRLSLHDLMSITHEWACENTFLEELKASGPPGENHGNAVPGGQVGKRRAASTTWAFGGEIAGSGRAVMVTQPHDIWYPRQPVRLTIPGKLDLFAVTEGYFPVFFSWTNGHVAHSVTCHSGITSVVYRLDLAPNNPFEYMIDGKAKRLEVVTVDVIATSEDGTETKHSRNFYRSEYGFVLGGEDYPWDTKHAYALRRVSESTGESVSMSALHENVLSLSKADEVVDAVVALERNSGLSLFYVDAEGTAAAVPNDLVVNLSEELWTRCAAFTQRGAPDARLDGPPILDGSRSECALPTGEGTRTPGVIARGEIPIIINRRAIMGGNQTASLWDPESVVSGYSRLVDRASSQPEPQTLEGRHKSHRMVLKNRLKGSDGQPGNSFTLETALGALYNGVGYWQSLAKDTIVAACLDEPLRQGSDQSTDLTTACQILREWDGRNVADSRGAMLWQAFWNNLPAHGQDGRDIFVVHYDPRQPYDTPHTVDPSKLPLILDRLAETVRTFQNKEIPLDISVGEARRLVLEGREYPLPGCDPSMGCDNAQSLRMISQGRAEDVLDFNGGVMRVEANRGDYSYVGGNITIAYAFEEPGSVRIRYGGPVASAFNHINSPLNRVGAALWAEGAFVETELEAEVPR